MASVIKANLVGFEDRYADSLRNYLSAPCAATLSAANSLGQAMLNGGASIADLTATHMRALARVGAQEFAAEAGAQPILFLARALAPFDAQLHAATADRELLSQAVEQLRSQDTAHERANQALAETKSILESVLEASDACICLKDRQGRFLYVNQRFEKVFRRPRGEILDHIRVGMVPAEMVEDFLRCDRRVLETGESLEREDLIPTPEGERSFLCLRFPLYDRNHAICGVGSIATDITRRKRTQAQIRKFEDLFHHAEWGIALAAPGGETNEIVNPAYARMHGYAPEELVGKRFISLYPPQLREFAAEQIRITYQLGRNTFETIRMRKDGSTFPALVTSMAVRDKDGRILYGAATVQDLTGQKEAARAIQDKEAAEKANRELEAFSYSVAHDLRSPLHVIGGFSRILMTEYADRLDTKGKTYLNYLNDSAQRMAQTIEDLLALSGANHHDLRRARVDLTAAARAVAARYHSSMPQRKIEFLIADGLEADCDPRLIAVVLENLLGNAWKFTRKRDSARIEFGVQPDSRPAVFFVRDNGAGFDMTKTDKLFTAFQRLHSTQDFEGTGIGLSTVHRIIQRHGGRIWAEGAIDQGASFYFTLDEPRPTHKLSGA